MPASEGAQMLWPDVTVQRDTDSLTYAGTPDAVDQEDVAGSHCREGALVSCLLFVLRLLSACLGRIVLEPIL